MSPESPVAQATEVLATATQALATQVSSMIASTAMASSEEVMPSPTESAVAAAAATEKPTCGSGPRKNYDLPLHTGALCKSCCGNEL